MTENKARLIQRYLSNNHRFEKTDPLYRKAYLLNALLNILLLNCSIFVVVDIFLFKMYMAAAINAAAVVFALVALVYFRRTNRYELVAKVSVAILLMCLIAFFRVTGNQHYSFVWLFIFPPIAYFLLDRITARIVTGLLRPTCCTLSFPMRRPGARPRSGRRRFSISWERRCAWCL